MNEPKKPSLIAKMRRRLSGRNIGLEETLETVIETHAEETGETTLTGDARVMMRNVIGFADMRVKDLMVPRATIIAIDEVSSMREILEQFIEANHSRLPIYRESLDDIVGMLHVKDFLKWMTARGKGKKLPKGEKNGLSIPSEELSSTLKQNGSLKRQVLFVPPSMPAPDLLLKMKASHIHLAVVVDEYGGTDGLVSLEDLIEVIIGDISDEHDTDEAADLLIKLDEQTYLANGLTEITKLDQELGLNLLPEDQKDEADTLAGLVFELAGRVPTRGEIIKHSTGLEFEILESDARRIKRLRIHVRKNESPTKSQAKTD